MQFTIFPDWGSIMLSNTLHEKGISELLKNYSGSSSVVFYFKNQWIQKYEQSHLLTISPLLRQLFSDPFIGLAQESAIVLPDYTEEQANSLMKLLSMDWSLNDKWSKSDIDFFKGLGINITADSIIEVSEESEIYKKEVLSHHNQQKLVPVEIIDEELEDEVYPRLLDVRCSLRSDCKFTIRGASQKVTRGLKKHLGFAHFSTELGLIAIETFDKDQCSFCGDLFLSSNRRMEHVLLKHDVLSHSVDNIVHRTITNSSSTSTRKPKRRMKRSREASKVKEEEEIILTPKRKAEFLNDKKDQTETIVEDPEESYVKDEESGSIKESDRVCKRKRDSPKTGKMNDAILTPNVKKCRVLLQNHKIKEENRNTEKVLNSSPLKSLMGYVKNSHRVDLDCAEDLSSMFVDGPPIAKISKQEDHHFNFKSEKILTNPSIETNQTNIITDKEIEVAETRSLNADLIDSFLVNVPESIDSNLEEGQQEQIDILSSEVFKEVTKDESFDNPSKARNRSTKIVEMNKIVQNITPSLNRPYTAIIKASPQTPKNPTLIVENPMFEEDKTPVKEKINESIKSPNASLKKTMLVRLEMKRSLPNNKSPKIENRNKTKENESNICIDIERKEPADYERFPVIDKRKKKKINLVKSSQKESGKNVKPEKVEAEDEVIVDEIISSPNMEPDLMSAVDQEIQRSLILDQDLSDDEEECCVNPGPGARFTDARESLMKELGIIEDEIVVC